MKAFRIVFAIALIAHGLAHASAGMWATDMGGHALVTLLWEFSAVGFMVAGIALLGAVLLRWWWRVCVTVAALSSLALLLLYSHPLFIAGIAADLFAIAVAIATLRSRFDKSIERLRPLSAGLLLAFTGYVAVIIAARSWYSSWGTTRSEQLMPLIGDPPLGQSHYSIDHAITINAPVDSVWKWLVQIGQDRAGFYSYDKLERLFGADIHNADRVVPEWQQISTGDFVRAVQPSFLGGVLGTRLGWNVKEVIPGRAIVLENWGAFVLTPDGPGRTRMHIRTRGTGVPTLSGIAITPVSLLVFEPAHFIMERGMLLGIKQRAERGS